MAPPADPEGHALDAPESPHPPAERLRAFSRGQVGDFELGEIAGHLDACPACRARLEGLAAGDGFLSRLQEASGPGGSACADEKSRRRAMRVLREVSGHTPRTEAGDGAASAL